MNEKTMRNRIVSNGRKSRWLTLGVLSIGIPCAVVGAPGLASAADASDKATAEALFQQGKALMEQQQYQQACDKFRASQELDAGVGTLLHLADCYEKEGRTASAWATFHEASSVAASRGDTNRQNIAQGRADALEANLSYILIRAAAGTPGDALVTRDGRPVPAAVWGVPVPVDPGTIAVQVSALGYESVSVTVTVPARAPSPIEVTLPALKKGSGGVVAAEPQQRGPTAPNNAVTAPSSSTAGAEAVTAPSPPPPPPPVEPSESNQATWGLVLGGAGIVALGVSAVFTASGYSSYKDSLDDCSSDNENQCGVSGTAERRDALSDLSVATIVGGAGAVVLGTGFVLYLTAPSATATPDAQQAVRTRGVGLGYQGVW